MLIKLEGGRVVDPAHDRDAVEDLWLSDGRVVAGGGGETPDETYDCEGCYVLAGAIDPHSHIAGGNVNAARALLPEAHRPALERRLELSFARARWSAAETGHRYAAMGFTTVVEPAMSPVGALAAQVEMADIPIIDTAGLVVLGNDDFLLRLLRERESDDAIADYVAWSVRAARALGIKVINPGGAAAFKAGARTFGLDDVVPDYGVSSRDILRALLRAVYATGIPHPLHVHCNNLGVPGNVETAIDTMAAAEGLPIHLAHLQFYGYGDEGKRGFSSAAARLAAAVNEEPNVTIDVGQVLFGPTVTISSDTMRQWDARRIARPNKWALHEDLGNGGGIVPYDYREGSFVNALQWAIGLELFLLIDDPWRVFFTTDHPNGAPFTRYPELFALLMDAGLRREWIARCPKAAMAATMLGEIEREYSVKEIAIVTRAGPARLLGLYDRGHLNPGARADVAVYDARKDKAELFARARRVFKDGRLVVDDGVPIDETPGTAQWVAPELSPQIEARLKRYYDEFYGLSLDAFTIPDGVVGAPERFRLHRCLI